MAWPTDPERIAEAKRKMSAAHKARGSRPPSRQGAAPWNKGLETGPNPEHSLRMKGRKSWNEGKKTGPLSDEHKAKLSKVHAGRSPWMKGRKHTQQTKDLLRSLTRDEFKYYWKGRSNPNTKGEKCVFWKGGLTSKNKLERGSYKYKAWRISVFERDDYTCQLCFVRGGLLQADHIKPFSTHVELRYELSNGRTLCVGCHETTDTFPRQLRGRAARKNLKSY